MDFMARKRPAAVITMAVLNFVFGGLGLIGSLCLALGGLGLVALSKQPGGAGGQHALAEYFKEIDRELPSYRYVMVASTTIWLVKSVLLIVAGFGLLGLRPWGRWLSVFCALVTIPYSLGYLAYNSLCEVPATRRVLARLTPGQRADVATNIIGGILGSAVAVGFAVALLVVMFLPHVARAFRPLRRRSREEYLEDDDGNGRRRDDWDDRDDDPDDDYDRRPRRRDRYDD
jgi:hypothetical protein